MTTSHQKGNPFKTAGIPTLHAADTKSFVPADTALPSSKHEIVLERHQPASCVETESKPEADAHFGGLLSCVGDLVVQIDRQGAVLGIHCPSDYELQLSGEGIVGHRFSELLPSAIALNARHYLEKTIRTGKPQVFTCQYGLSGRIRDYQARMAPSGPDEITVVVRDVTDRRAFEKEILDVCHKTQLRIGQDLHDGLGQHLSGITFLSKALERKLSSRGLPEAQQASEIAHLVIQALAQTRNLARGLFPVELESGGLVPALRELAATMRSLYKLSFELECEAHLDVQEPTVANHLFRLAQEAVNNAVKHGHAGRIILRLCQDQDQLVLTITDDGTGFDAERNDANGLGMRIMRYRAKRIGADLRIHAAISGGTEVECRVRQTVDEAEDPAQKQVA